MNDSFDQETASGPTLRQLATFVAVARAGSTRAAAERVARSQSAASAALAELETALGARLFDRVEATDPRTAVTRSYTMSRENLPPYNGGGEMIEVVTRDRVTYNTPPHRFEATFGKRNHPILFAFSVANKNLPPLKIDVLDSQPANLQQPHPRAIEQFTEKPHQTPGRTRLQNPANFVV